MTNQLKMSFPVKAYSFSLFGCALSFTSLVTHLLFGLGGEPSFMTWFSAFVLPIVNIWLIKVQLKLDAKKHELDNFTLRLVR